MRERLQSTAQLYGKPFYAELTLEKSENKITNDETGEKETRTYWNNGFANRKAPNEVILSVAEYRERFASAAPTTDGPRRIVKKAEQPAPVPFDVPEEEDEF